MSITYDHLCTKCHFERGDETSHSYHQRQYLKLLVDYVCPENVTEMSTQIQQQTHGHSKTTFKRTCLFFRQRRSRGYTVSISFPVTEEQKKDCHQISLPIREMLSDQVEAVPDQMLPFVFQLIMRGIEITPATDIRNVCALFKIEPVQRQDLWPQ